jgi:hypothetical protein
MTSEPEVYFKTMNVKGRVVTMGASHSSGRTEELDDTCLEVIDISRRGWRLIKEAVDEKVKKLAELVATTD